MKLKLSNDELIALRDAVQLTVDHLRSEASELLMEEKLRLALFEELLFKLSSKLLIRQSEYGITLKPSWAIALHLQFAGNVKLISYEGRTIQRICDQIHQRYS